MKRKLSTVLFRNFQYKLAALILATLFWYIVQGEEILEINHRVSISIKVPPGLMLQGPDVRYKDVTIRGPRVLLGDVASKHLEATIDVPEGRTGQLRYRVDAQMIQNWDQRLKLTVHDPYLNLVVDDMLSKKVPVREYIKGVPAEGYIIEKVSITPGTVIVTGLKNEITKIDQVMTEPIDVEGMQQSKAIEAKLVPQEIPISGLSEEKVMVNLQVGEKKINRQYTSVPVELVGSDYLAEVNPRYVNIVVQGTPGVLSFVKRSDFEAFVDIRDLQPGKKHTRAIQVKIPNDTVLIETVPQNATVEIYNQKRLK